MKLKKISTILVSAMCVALLSGCSMGSADSKTSADMKKKYNSYVTLGDYSKVYYEPVHTEVTDEDIQNEIDSLVSSKKTKAQITDRVATMGDAVNIDYVGTIDGTAFDGGNTNGTGTVLVLGSHSYIDTFEQQIAGHKPGEEFDVKVTFPSDYGAKNLAGKEAVFATKLNYIEGEEITPKYSDAFVASNTDYKTTAEYEEAMRKKHEETNSASDAAQNEEAILQSVIDSSIVGKYPEKDLKTKIDSIQGSIQDLADSNGVDVNSVVKMYGYSSIDEFKNNIADNVKKEFTRRIVVCAIAYNEKITCSDDEADAIIQNMLKTSGYTDVDALNKAYGYAKEDYYYSVLEKKVIDFLKTKAVASPSDAPAK